ncbi:hypothetical protein F0562_019532 [Nyssa sinensis]|uniref:Uncharacterized protein n=1 Tax=Nyssa sinensis TaxID=561372 RepID=A0A5J5BQ36_9ASTE|nr:hypothetical protein F0562_019532 [Nyssa sinensis]
MVSSSSTGRGDNLVLQFENINYRCSRRTTIRIVEFERNKGVGVDENGQIGQLIAEVRSKTRALATRVEVLEGNQGMMKVLVKTSLVFVGISMLIALAMLVKK